MRLWTNTRWGLGALGAVVCALTAHPVAANTEAQAPASPAVVSLGVEDDWPPFAWVEKSGQAPRGYSVEVVSLAFREMGVPVEFVAMPFGRCMHEVRVGKTVGCFNSIFNDDARKDYLLHSAPLFNEPLAVLARASVPRQTIDAKGLEGRTVGYVQGFQYPEWFMTSKRIVRVSAGSESALLRMLERNRVDLAISGASVAAWRLQTDSDLRDVKVRMVGQVSNDGFGVAFSKRHPQGEVLRNGFDQALLKLQANDGLRELQRKYLPRLPQ